MSKILCEFDGQRIVNHPQAKDLRACKSPG
jgi:hypothetical protein